MAVALRHAVLSTTADGIRTVDLGGDATTSEVSAHIIARVLDALDLGRDRRE